MITIGALLIPVVCVAVAQTAEWTLEDAARQWPPMTKAVQHVGVPGCQWQVGVYWDGSLIFGQTLHRVTYIHPRLADELKLAGVDNNLLHLSVAHGDQMRFADRTGTNSPLLRKGLVGGRLPVPWVETQDGDLVWNEVVFAHLLDREPEEGMRPRPDDQLIVQVRFAVRNRGYCARTGHLWLHFGDATKTASISQQLPDLAPELAHSFRSPFGWIGDKVRYALPAPAKGKLVWHDEVAPVGVGGPAKRVLEWEVPLAAGEEADLRLVLPYGLVDEAVAGRAMEVDFDRELEAMCRFWRRCVYGPGQIATPDPFVNDYLVAVAGQMAEQVAYRHVAKLWMYKTSPNWYEDYYGANTARALPTFDLRGLTDLSRPVLRSFIEWQTDDPSSLIVDRGGGQMDKTGYIRTPGLLGSFGPPVTNATAGDPKQGWTANASPMCHGAALWALAQHYRITRDAAWLGKGPGSPLQAMLDACDWVTAQRARTKGMAGKPYRGLLAPASAHDWLSGSAIFNDAWCVFGMAETVRLLREIKHPRAEGIAKDVADYRSCLRARYAEARDKARRVPLQDGTSIPFMPRVVTELDWASVDWTYTGYGPLRAGALGALDPRDEMVDQALAFVEAGRPVSGDISKREYFWRHYVDPETMWPVYDLFLQRDDLPRFFELAFGFLGASIHNDFRVGCESRDGVVSVAPGDAERWRMVRDMFVNEVAGYDGGEQSLFLLQAIPMSWLRPGNHLSVSKMGTCFGGTCDLTVDVAVDGDSVRVDASLRGLAVRPAGVVMRLRSGDGRPLRSATVNGSPVEVLAGDTIRLPVVVAGKFKVVGRF